MTKKTIVFLVLGLARFLLAIDSDFQTWLQLNQTFSLNEKVSLFSEVHPRISIEDKRLVTFIGRAAALYTLDSHWTVGLGILWQPTYVPSFVDESRFFIQVNLNQQPFTSTSVSHRLRLEDRNLSSTADTAYRMRYQIRTLNSWFDQSSWRVLLANELFYNLNTTQPSGPVSGMDQNRLYLGFNKKWSDSANSDFAYLFNYVRRPRSPEDRFNHAIFYALNASF